MKKIARNKLNAIFKKSGFLTFEKISMIFKIDFSIIYNTYTPNLGQRNFLQNRYTFLSISLHFLIPSAVPLTQRLELRFLAICSFDLKLRFYRASLYLETSYQRTFIQTYFFSKAISVAKLLQFAQKAVIMNKNQRLVHCVSMNKNQRFTLQGEVMNHNPEGRRNNYAYNSNTSYC